MFRRGLPLGLALALGAASAVSRAEEPVPLEQQVKAAFLVKFALFVEWPEVVAGPEQSRPFTIGILGQDPFGSYFDSAAKDLHINGHPIRLERGQSVSELAECQVIFISSSESGRLEEILAELRGKPVLTVADEPEAIKRGVMINFLKENGKVAFELNNEAASGARLILSAKLQQVAKRRSPRSTGGGR